MKKIIIILLLLCFVVGSGCEWFKNITKDDIINLVDVFIRLVVPQSLGFAIAKKSTKFRMVFHIRL